MHRPFLPAVSAAFALALILPGVASAAPSAPAALAPIAPIAAFVKTSNAGDRSAFLALFAPDAVIVDDFAPHRFSAPSAAAHWYDGFAADAATQHQDNGTIVAHAPSAYHVTGRHAWASIQLDYRYTHNGHAELETGSLIFTLREIGATWKIDSMSWARLTDTDSSAVRHTVPKALQATLDAFVAADNAGNRAGVVAVFTPDALVVDEFAPYRFPAPGAAAAWYKSAGVDSTANDYENGVGTFSVPSYAAVDGDRAWLTVPALYSYVKHGVPTVEHGAVAVSALHTASGWKLTTMAWATLSVTRGPKAP
jgi:ketosteroid isomerase-like protein